MDLKLLYDWRRTLLLFLLMASMSWRLCLPHFLSYKFYIITILLSLKNSTCFYFNQTSIRWRG